MNPIEQKRKMSASDEQKARKLSISGREIFKAALSGEVVVLNPDDSVEEQELVSVVVNCLPLGVSFVPTRHLEMRVDGFVQDQEGKPYDVQASGRVTRGDLLHAVGDHSTGPDFGANAKLIQQSQFPITLHFRKQNLALGRYSLAELQEHCATDFKSWLPGYSREDRALLLQELILVEQAEDEKISLGAFVKRLLKDREHASKSDFYFLDGFLFVYAFCSSIGLLGLQSPSLISLAQRSDENPVKRVEKTTWSIYDENAVPNGGFKNHYQSD